MIRDGISFKREGRPVKVSLEEHVGGRTSVTELEILHGVLNNPAMADHSYFYFRDAAYIDSIPEEDRKDSLAENPEAAEKLKNLKDSIRKNSTIRDNNKGRAK